MSINSANRLNCIMPPINQNIVSTEDVVEPPYKKQKIEAKTMRKAIAIFNPKPLKEIVEEYFLNFFYSNKLKKETRVDSKILQDIYNASIGTPILSTKCQSKYVEMMLQNRFILTPQEEIEFIAFTKNLLNEKMIYIKELDIKLPHPNLFFIFFQVIKRFDDLTQIQLHAKEDDFVNFVFFLKNADENLKNRVVQMTRHLILEMRNDSVGDEWDGLDVAIKDGRANLTVEAINTFQCINTITFLVNDGKRNADTFLWSEKSLKTQLTLPALKKINIDHDGYEWSVYNLLDKCEAPNLETIALVFEDTYSCVATKWKASDNEKARFVNFMKDASGEIKKRFPKIKIP